MTQATRQEAFKRALKKHKIFVFRSKELAATKFSCSQQRKILKDVFGI